MIIQEVTRRVLMRGDERTPGLTVCELERIDDSTWSVKFTQGVLFLYTDQLKELANFLTSVL